MAKAPALIRLSNPLTRRLLRVGVPMGPNLLLTVRGRSTGLPRTAPVAAVEVGGRRWIIGAYGEVQWVRNLRAAGEADIEAHRRSEHVTAVALSRDEATAFFRDVLQPYVRSFPLLGRVFGRVLFGLIAPDVLNDPARAAALRPVFELHSAPDTTRVPYRGDHLEASSSGDGGGPGSGSPSARSPLRNSAR